MVGNRKAASDAIREAYQRLLDRTSKDFLNLQILEADLTQGTDPQDTAEIHKDVLGAGDGNGDAQKSDIMARAHLQLGKVWTALGDNENSLAESWKAAAI